MSEDVVRAIRSAIRERGPVTFAEFMELALYGPGGFYEEPPVGREGHFVTSPHVHPVFGRLLGHGLERMWKTLGRPDPFVVVELGAGDGTLARQVLEALRDIPVEYVAVERSAGARASLARLPVRVAAELEEGTQAACVIANELLDNLPFRRVSRTAGRIVELEVGESGDRFVEVETPCDEELADLCPPLHEGETAVVPVGALSLIDRLSAHLSSGYALLIDYGEASGMPAGPVHGYRSHRVVEAVLDEPGSADITAGVDFTVLARRARDHDLQTLGPVSQRDALKALGFHAWAEGERTRQVRMLESGEGIGAVRAWGGRSEATLLVDPAGLGRLQWLAVAAADLAWPAWLEEASRAR
ncbi:MAG: SAM-dependent methyltransferase [Actinomycetota bacterium]